MIRLTDTEASYITTALWASIDEYGDPLDSAYGAEDIDRLPEFLADLHDFLAEPDVAEILARRNISPEQAAHDFWLDRERHGAGAWDRGYGADGVTLTKAAHTYGGQDLMPGDDGRLYWS